ncbi:MAG: DUF3850 domain-containing protein [bacterium]|nr:DUF3850 domain-containing protein [bacterium]
MAIIKKKVWKEYFDLVASGKKKFDIRLGDVEINEGDTLILEEWDNDKKDYTGRTIETTATYVMNSKKLPFWPKEQIDKFGLQVISIELKNK